MKNRFLLLTIITGLFFVSCHPKESSDKQSNHYPIKGVPFNEVHLTDHFWSPKIETNRTVTIPASFQKCEEEGRLENFLIAGGKMEGEVRGAMPFDDTDVYKIIEGASYSLTTTPDPELEAYVDSLIEIISIGQEEDGYLTTWKTIDPTNSPAPWCPPGERWEGLESSHELYNSGHMFEAAAAHYHATGKRNFLDIALKNADLLVNVFGKEGNVKVPGHQIVETGLIKLYQITGNKEYLSLARHFLDCRGDSTLRELWGPYNQDHKPVVEQTEAVGHAVRAAYMYAGMTDIAALYNDSAYRKAVDDLWNNVVYKKLYITGGIGSRHDGESFGENYELPNLTAYNETCAAIANVYWNYRMFLLHGDAKYIDVLERSLYNGVISGVGLDGKTFFYPNPLSCDLQYKFNQGALTRKPWFDCSCCPTNLCRFMPSVPGYIYAQNDDAIYVNLFVESETDIDINGTSVNVSQKTNYPWDGDININVSPKTAGNFKIMIRIPGWAQGEPVPGDLYDYKDKNVPDISLTINGDNIDYSVENGYAVITRNWNKRDVIQYHLPMPVHRIIANSKVEADRNKIALERGPIVYCAEGVDNKNIDELRAPDEQTDIKSSFQADMLGGVQILEIEGAGVESNFKAIPYYVWNNRGATKMKVWLPENP